MVTKKLSLHNAQEALDLLGEQDIILRQMERDFRVEMFLAHDVGTGDMNLTLKGAAGRVDKALRRLRERLEIIRRGTAAPEGSPLPTGAPDFDPTTLPPDAIYRSAHGKLIKPRTKNQSSYIRAIQDHELVFGIGPAGTGKTFLAIACALRSLAAREVHRVVLTRPVVEAGERLGFLPGDLLEKVSPYLRPLYDAFYALIGPQRFKLWRDNEIVEVVPLAYMRGRTFEDAFIVLDEAQNTTPEQMKMFLTRMGIGSRVVVTGDITQTDLASNAASGLIQIINVLKGMDEAAFHRFGEEDVVRHPLVKRIIHAYATWDKKK